MQSENGPILMKPCAIEHKLLGLIFLTTKSLLNFFFFR